LITYYNEDTKFDTFIADCLTALFDKDEPTADIEIEWQRCIGEGYAGLCNGSTDEVGILLSTHFKLECGEELPYTDAILASNLAHELVHARQFIRGEINSDNYYYKGNDYEAVEYAETPWEIEAYALEDVLVDLFWSKEC